MHCVRVSDYDNHLCDTLQGQLLHEIDDVRLLQEFLFELLDSHREGG